MNIPDWLPLASLIAGVIAWFSFGVSWLVCQFIEAGKGRQ